MQSRGDAEAERTLSAVALFKAFGGDWSCPSSKLRARLVGNDAQHERRDGPVGPQAARTCFTREQLQTGSLAPTKVLPAPPQGKRAPKCVVGQTDMVNGKAVMTGNCQGPLGARKIIWTGSQ